MSRIITSTPYNPDGIYDQYEEANQRSNPMSEDSLREKINARFGLNAEIPTTYQERIDYCNQVADEMTQLLSDAIVDARLVEVHSIKQLAKKANGGNLTVKVLNGRIAELEAQKERKDS